MQLSVFNESWRLNLRQVNALIKVIYIRLKCRLYNHSGDNEAEDPPVPIPNTEVKLCVAESTMRDTAWEDRELPDFKKAQSQPIVVVASFFATFYPPTEGEKHILKIVQWTILVFRGEPTTRYSGWR